MIVADRNMLKASLAKGVLQIQLTLIQLYTSNLNAIGTQAALIAGFAFTGIAETPYPNDNFDDEVIEYFYYFFITLTLVSGLFAVSQATIVTLYGPAMALSGETPEAVTSSVSSMRGQQDFVFKVGGVAITSLFLSAICLSWARRPRGVATVNTLVYLTVYYLMVSEGRKAYMLFSNIKEEVGAYEDPTKDKPDPTKKNPLKDSSKKSAAVENAAKNTTSGISEEAENSLEAGAQTRARGVLWMRQSLSKGGHLEQCYAVLEKGKLDVYKSEQHFINHENPINKHPFQLWKYTLELDPRKFNRGFSSASKSARKLLTGQGEFSVTTLMTSEYDLREASKKFRFIMHPKVHSELQPLQAAEFMANDEQSYKLWVKAIGRVIRCLEELDANPTVESTMRANADVELVVNAASRT